jgi:hypothetical protein
MIRRTSAVLFDAGAGLAGVLAILLLTVACDRTGDDAADVPDVAASEGNAAPAEIAFEVDSDPQDSVIFEQRMALAREQRLDTLPVGKVIAALGRTFVGTPYTPGTLEAEGPERLIVNLRELDCVTFVENMLAMSRIIVAGHPDYQSFKSELARIRYRDGHLDGYPSRLHYFSEWIANNAAKGVVQEITTDIGGVPDSMALTFMTSHRESYRQLKDEATFGAIGMMEKNLAGKTRYYVPEDRIAQVADRIQDGDIIGATSTLEGLDVAHTGIALRVDGKLHLMHAPLVGKAVEISTKPLADRILEIKAQDGIMVARPQPPARR